MIRPPSSQCAQCTISSARNLRSVWGPEWGVPISSGADSLWVAQNGGGYQKGGGFNPFFLVSVEVRGS